MGEAKIKQMSKRKFLAKPENKFCVYCGAPATTIDHFPPRNFFYKRQAPEGYTYPSCNFCNSGKSSDEQALSLIVMMSSWEVDKDESRFDKLVRAVQNNRPEIIAEMTPLSNEQSKLHLRQVVGSQDDVLKNKTAGWQIVDYGPEAIRLMNKMCVWFGQTLYFKHNKELFTGEIFVLTLPEYVKCCKKFQELKSEFDGAPNITHTSHDISKQFSYQYFAAKGIFCAILHFEAPQIFFLICALSQQTMNPNINVLDGWYRSGLVGPKIK
ncbi:hypothetical protein GT348_07685 [Aristophania vespae]|uniref:HNH endonuclease n=1 Tax=Aristophania vespae TaxID=2697033 RepID=A0A6P1NFA4_9PROT|nr:hypothetical protein [Aristophania vespae]QHI96128.1 hypothetical protein GT348_07685 [Aristophania vespae]